MNKSYWLHFVCLGALASTGLSQTNAVFQEKDGMVVVEAENFHSQDKTTTRKWYLTSSTETPNVKPDPDPSHASSASGKAYLEILPDTRVTHSDPLGAGVSFSNTGGETCIVNYKVNFSSAGKYYVWVCAYSAGSAKSGSW